MMFLFQSLLPKLDNTNVNQGSGTEVAVLNLMS
jgi:hypothetical protein